MLVAIGEFHNTIKKLNLLYEPVMFVDFSLRFVETFGHASVDELKASLPGPQVVTESSMNNRRHRRTHSVDEQIKRFLNRIGILVAARLQAQEEMQPVVFKEIPTWAIAALAGCSLVGLTLAAIGNYLNKTHPEQSEFGQNPKLSRRTKRRWRAGFSGGIWAG
jgi:hypothetical protein